MSTVRVHLADAPTDVLVYLVGLSTDARPTTADIIDAVAVPSEVIEAATTVVRGLRLLLDLGYAQQNRYGGRTRIWATTAGRMAVAEAFATDSHASVSSEQTPSPAADSAHSGDQCTVGETP